jgi:hypothetical protein
MENFGEEYFTMHLLMSNLTKDQAFFSESFLINMLPSYIPYGYNKATEKYRLNRQKEFSSANIEFFKELVNKKDALKTLYCENPFF